MQPETSSPTAYVIDPKDNVATLLRDATEGESISAIGSSDGGAVRARGSIESGHKMALRRIPSGDDVLKFGVAIGFAIIDIEAGDWVHLHNCASHYDSRSATLDADTGETRDTIYE
jgi:hypothetical protein